tara:strand:- start:1939 stop:2406 length:468 start_codon:yes stop_codon:yes gene_type:complete
MNFLLLCILLLIGYCLINFYDNQEYFKNDKHTKDNINQNQISLKKLILGGNSNNKNKFIPQLKLFSVEWCGHCKRFKKQNGVWNKLKNNPIFKNKLEFIDIDGDEQPKLVQDNDIEGYPTLILFCKNKKILYNGDRTEKDIIKFLKKHIKNLRKK